MQTTWKGAKTFDFRRATVFCLGYRLSKHKMIRYSINLGVVDPVGHPGYAYVENHKLSILKDIKLSCTHFLFVPCKSLLKKLVFLC